MRSLIGAALMLAVVSRGAVAQSEAALRAAFEGKTITLKLDMPATSQGVDLYPLEQEPLRYRDLAQRLKDHGTAIKMGQQIMITKVVVKGTSHIEMQLGGGGYGTFTDMMNSGSDPSHVSAGETKEERALRDSITRAQGPTKRKQFERDLANLRSARERENSRAQAEVEQARIMRESNIRSRKLESGSRFNIRYKPIPPDALTPEGVRKALGKYVDFADGGIVAASSGESGSASPRESRDGKGGIAAIRKGLTLKEVEAILGPASTANEVKEGSMTVMKRTYRHDGMKVLTSFVSDVLIDFTISPQ